MLLVEFWAQSPLTSCTEPPAALFTMELPRYTFVPLLSTLKNNWLAAAVVPAVSWPPVKLVLPWKVMPVWMVSVSVAEAMLT